MRLAPGRQLSAGRWGWPYFFTGVLLNSVRLQSGLMNGFSSFIIWVASGAILGASFARPWGIEGRCVGSLLGFLIASVLTWAIWLGRILLFYPFPACRLEKCRGIEDYRWSMDAIFGRVGRGVYLYSCKCGDEYIREGKRFMEILPDGNKRPHKILVGFRKWVDDVPL